MEEDVSHNKPKASLLTKYSGNILSLFSSAAAIKQNKNKPVMILYVPLEQLCTVE